MFFDKYYDDTLFKQSMISNHVTVMILNRLKRFERNFRFPTRQENNIVNTPGIPYFCKACTYSFSSNRSSLLVIVKTN